MTPPTATNLVGEPHTFTVSVDVLGADGTPTPIPAEDATVTWSFTGPGTLDAGATTCDEGTTGGTCEIVFTNTDAGAGTLTIESVTFSANGESFTVGLTDGRTGPGHTTADHRHQDLGQLPRQRLAGDRHELRRPGAHVHGARRTRLRSRLRTGGRCGGRLDDQRHARRRSRRYSRRARRTPRVRAPITVTSSDPGTLTLTATYEATSSSGATQEFSDFGDKEWLPGWTLTVVKESSVAGDTQPFTFETTGPAPLDDEPFALAIGESELFEDQLLPGTYTIAELVDAASLPAPWRFEAVECTGLEEGATASYEGAVATLTLEEANPGSAITCTFTNERRQPRGRQG